MIEQGLNLKISQDAGVAALVPGDQGFLEELPKGVALPNWTYQWIGERSDTALQTTKGLSFAMMQIDCYGATGNDVVKLASAITQVIDGYQGILADPDHTFVDSIFRRDARDAPYDPNARNYRRSLDFAVNYRRT